MSEHEPEATPEQQEQVRRLLAEARHTEPLGPEVAARLDGVLAQLVAEGPRAIDPPPPAPHAAVVDLAAKRRRRVSGLLVAAAAVVVIGVGVSQVVDSAGGDGDPASSDTGAAGGAADLDDAESFTSREQGTADEIPEVQPSLAAPGTTDGAASPEVVPTISRRSFADDAERLRALTGVVVQNGDLVSGAELSADPMFVCPAADWGRGRLVGVLYDDVPSVLAYRASPGDTVTVELLQCGSAKVLRSIVLPGS